MTNVKEKTKEVITDQEVQNELQEAEKLPEFFRLRAKATLALLETGKRRSEIVSLEKTDITQDDSYLYVRFTVMKKRKKNIRTLQRVKKFARSSNWATMIVEYLDYLKERWPDSKFVYPAIRSIFGFSMLLDNSKHAEPQEIWRIVKTLNPNDWPHQHREKRAVKVIRNAEAKRGSADLNTVYQVRDVLDLERETTAYNYIRRFQTQRVEDEEIGDEAV
jgi:integrase